jgi:hypothetical protein
VKVERDAPAVVQMTQDAVMDENVSYEDVMLLPDALSELRRAGFGKFLPPKDQCPPSMRRRAPAARAKGGKRTRVK